MIPETEKSRGREVWVHACVRGCAQARSQPVSSSIILHCFLSQHLSLNVELTQWLAGTEPQEPARLCLTSPRITDDIPCAFTDAGDQNSWPHP